MKNNPLSKLALTTVIFFMVTSVSPIGYAEQTIGQNAMGQFTPVMSLAAAEDKASAEEAVAVVSDSTVPDGPLSAASAEGPISPSQDKDVTDIEPLPVPDPDPVTVSAQSWMASISPTGRGAVMNYDTSWAGWAGGGFSFDSAGSMDLSATSQLIIGLKGDVSTLKFEIVDVNNNKSSVHLTGILSQQEQVWVIDTSRFQGVDLSNTRLLYFIVEGQYQTGKLEMNIQPVEAGSVNPDADLTVNQVTRLPETWSTNGTYLPQQTVVAPPDSQTAIETTSRGVRLNYANGADGWSGGGLTFDDFSTAQTETVDMRYYPELIIGLRGDAAQVKLEVIDEWNQRAVIYLSGIESDTTQFWNIPTAAFSGIDLTRIRIMYFILEGAYETGTLDILYQTPSKGIIPGVVPVDDGLLSDHTQLPPASAMVIAPVEATVTSTATARGLHMDYQTNNATWAGSGLTFDDFATAVVESFDAGGYPEFVFGLKGDAATVKLEFVDAFDNKRAVYVEGIRPDQELMYRIPASYLQGIDLTRLRMIFVIVEGPQQTGAMEFTHVPVDFSGWAPAPSDPRFGFRRDGILEVMDFRTGESQIITFTDGTQNHDVILDGKYAVYDVPGHLETHIFGLESPLTGVFVPSASNPDYWFIDSYTYSGFSGWYQQRLAVVNILTGEETELVNMSKGVGFRDAFSDVYDVSPDGGYAGNPKDITIVVQSLDDPSVKVEIPHFTTGLTLRLIQWLPGIAIIEAVVDGVTMIYEVNLSTLEVRQIG
ncbi:MAG: hypothetical protein Q8R76_08760 [Candidatus Omnitrophota bacterium]|nr:hypothetical protein [Candidatus Omnitrophota bacterium]